MSCQIPITHSIWLSIEIIIKKRFNIRQIQRENFKIYFLSYQVLIYKCILWCLDSLYYIFLHINLLVGYIYSHSLKQFMFRGRGVKHDFYQSKYFNLYLVCNYIFTLIGLDKIGKLHIIRHLLSNTYSLVRLP